MDNGLPQFLMSWRLKSIHDVVNKLIWNFYSNFKMTCGHHHIHTCYLLERKHDGPFRCGLMYGTWSKGTLVVCGQMCYT